MAINDATLVNGVTKIELADGFMYYFPIATIETGTAATSITLTLTVTPFTTNTRTFEQITEQLGASDIEGYVDALANGAFFFNAIPGIPTIETATTDELDDAKILRPDGVGGVEWLISNELQFVTILNLTDLPFDTDRFVLADNTIYVPSFTTPQSSAFFIEFGVNSTWWTPNSGLGAWTYTGSGNAVEGGGNSIFIFGMQVTCSNPAAYLIDFDGQTATKNVVLERFTGVATNGIKVRNALFSFMNQIQLLNVVNGFEFSGSSSDVSFNNCRFQNYTGNAIDFGTSTNAETLINLVRFIGGGVGSFALSGLVDSLNVTDRAIVSHCIFNGSGGTLENITNCDLKWSFSGNVGNTGPEDSSSSMAGYVASGDEAITTITAIDTPVIMAGVWTMVNQCMFTFNAAGRATYIGLAAITLFVTSKIEVSPVSGSNVTYWMYFRKNGTLLDLTSRDVVRPDSGNPQKIILQTRMNLITGDYIDLVIENKTNTTNANTEAANLLIG